MKKFSILLFATSLLFSTLSCKDNDDDNTPTVPTDINNPLKSGEISVPVKADPSFSWAPATGSVNLGDLKVNSTNEPLMISIGEGVEAGYRDGGLYRQGQLTSYPNLVARQMGLAGFDQALFEKENGNGTGYLIKKNSAAIPVFDEVTNNLVYTEKGSALMKPYSGKITDNFSAPFGGRNIFAANPAQELAYKNNFYINNPQPAYLSNTNYLWVNGYVNASLFSRYVGAGYNSAWEYAKTITPEIALFETGIDAYILNNLRGGGSGLFGGSEFAWERQILNYLKEKGTKSILATVPEVLDFPYFKWYTYENLIRKTGKPIGIQVSDVSTPAAATSDIIFLPTTNVVNLYNGNFKYSYLTDEDVIRKDEISKPEKYNELLLMWSKQYNQPLVDFYAVYKKVVAGNYVSEDGFKIDPSYPNGNFFSADGLYPSAIGQAVLANEVIKVLNSSYRAQIPLINISNYAAEMSKVK
ncbi:hypothetical protein [Dyadobacter frigoris]|uniref:SGNH/GDSL hydrolase family protein n=1 Tax=Dyadobacter frigoris TaxID=2576211 RepID=A0A4V6BJQ5_9BACT|nr:hypothetical protein [Dyadobacter frigoris]TKT93113.1 hypothetical protein FDK13_04455 [Dyadobacter frigoris]GLU55987.1 hypothetical protein Dfri01_54480 [Dyadobacter frigoris]